jgi:GT2 family glycosyltransferase
VLNSVAYGGWKRDTVRDVDIVTGCFFLIRAADWQRLGGFDERFFMYGEEADLCLRARKVGLRPRFTPDATIVHYGGASEPVRANKMVRQMAAKALLIRTHFSGLARGPALLLLLAWPAIRAAGYGLASAFAPARYKAHFQTWKAVLCAAPVWLHGYPELQVPAADTGKSQ